MHSKFFLSSTALLIAICYSTAFSKSGAAPSYYTLQVASFPDTDSAQQFAHKILKSGESPVCTTIELRGRGFWTRVFVGVFNTPAAARAYGSGLVAQGIIKEFLVRKVESEEASIRPRRIAPAESKSIGRPNSEAAEPVLALADSAVRYVAGDHSSANDQPRLLRCEGSGCSDSRANPMPVIKSVSIERAPRIDTALVPRPDPVNLAFGLIVGQVRLNSENPRERGGLWITGDRAEGLARLKWIAGIDTSDFLKVEADGRVSLDKKLLGVAAGLKTDRQVSDPFKVLKYISSDEGVLLLVQLTEGRYRYRLHIGSKAPTQGSSVDLDSGINLDNNFDSRINPHRKNGKKLDSERPPDGFDSLVALNPVARWFNLRTNTLVPVGAITFHELAEALAKLDQGLDYLDQASRIGAHAVALERERRLKTQRPGDDIVLTAGINRVLRTEQEIRLFYAESAAGGGQH